MSQFKIEPGVIGGAEGQNKPQHHYDRVKNTHPQDMERRKHKESDKQDS